MEKNYKQAVKTLQDILQNPGKRKLSDTPNVKSIEDIQIRKKQVYADFKKDFQNIDTLSEERFHYFLSFKGNKHWTGLERQKRVTQDMEKLRHSLKLSADESKPLVQRINLALKNKPTGLKQAILSAFLHVAFRGKYAVWNNISKEALQLLGIWPSLRSFNGESYESLNNLLNKLAKDISTDLWTLDWLLWVVAKQPPLEKLKSTKKRLKSTENLIRKIREREQIVKQKHSELQNELYAKLVSIYGEKVVPPMETDHIDVMVNAKDTIILYEVKTGNPTDCIREGLGQVLNYLYKQQKKCNKQIRKVKVVIVGPKSPSKDEQKFIKFIKDNLSMGRLTIDFDYQWRKSQWGSEA